jgi:SAM-dependent methyltransferase
LAAGPVISSSERLREVRGSRRHPGITQYDYLHLRALVTRLREAIAEAPGPVEDVLDVWCGSRPYEDLLPAGARCTGLDVEGNPYGVADVVSNEILPFPDASFDVVLCIQAFHYMPDPEHSVFEFARVLRPGGTAVVASVFGFEYDRRHFEARYTEQQLRALFEDWDDVRVREDGGRIATWAVLTGSLLYGLEQRMRGPLKLLRPAFLASYALLNVLGLALQHAERAGTDVAFPVNLTVTARKPTGDHDRP